MSRLFGLVYIAALVLSACGGGTATATAAPSAAATAAASGKEVAQQGFALNPKALEIAVGTTVTWTNKDSTRHTVTSGTPSAKDGKFDSGPLTSGETFSFTFAQAGTVSYFCTLHPTTAGLMGTVVVK